jgi:hypothetical protein
MIGSAIPYAGSHPYEQGTHMASAAFFGPELGLVVALAFLGSIAAWLIYSGFAAAGTVLGSADIVSRCLCGRCRLA